MQRAPAPGERPDLAAPSDAQSTADGRASKWKTLEEREAAYAAAREKIYGKGGDVEESPSISKTEGEPPSRAAAALEDDIDPVPRRRYPAGGQFEVVYPSLYHPPKGSHTPSPAPGMADQYQQNPYGYQQAMGYNYQMDMNGYPLAGQMPSGYTQQQRQPQQGFAMQSYMDSQYNLSQQQAYTVPGWQPQAGGAYPQMTPNQQYSLMQAQQSGQWQYQQMVSQPMPMIPQGMPYPAGPAFGYPSQPLQPQLQPPQAVRPAMYPSLVQPSPQRPLPQPYSSASSSISSHSYHDGSRPHSRGSTTSTKSAASSVRLGAMYPAAQGPGAGYRQKGMKQQGLNGMTSLGTEDKRTRGHSPVSFLFFYVTPHLQKSNLPIVTVVYHHHSFLSFIAPHFIHQRSSPKPTSASSAARLGSQQRPIPSLADYPKSFHFRCFCPPGHSPWAQYRRIPSLVEKQHSC